MWITSSLWTALYHLRQADQDRVIWADAICINQRNFKERGQEVQRTGDIFRSAQRVIFWLGKATREIACLMIALRAFKDDLRRYAVGSSTLVHVVDTIDHHFLKSRWSRILEIDRRPLGSASNFAMGSALEMLFSRSWFQRLWVVQEVTLARTALICVGSFSVNSYIFKLAPLCFPIKLGAHARVVLNALPGLAAKPRFEGHDDLLALAHEFRHQKTSEERDKIYALQGLLDRRTQAGALALSYGLTVDKLLTIVLKSCFHSSRMTIYDCLEWLATFSSISTTLVIYPLPHEAASAKGAAPGPLQRRVPISERSRCSDDASDYSKRPFALILESIGPQILVKVNGMSLEDRTTSGFDTPGPRREPQLLISRANEILTAPGTLEYVINIQHDHKYSYIELSPKTRHAHLAYSLQDSTRALETAIGDVAQYGVYSLIRTLLAAGTGANVRLNDSILLHAVLTDQDIYQRLMHAVTFSSAGMTLGLCLAAHIGCLEQVHMLLQLGADPALELALQIPAKHCASYVGSEGQSLEKLVIRTCSLCAMADLRDNDQILKLLMDHGARLHAREAHGSADNFEDTAGHWNAFRTHVHDHAKELLPGENDVRNNSSKARSRPAVTTRHLVPECK